MDGLFAVAVNVPEETTPPLPEPPPPEIVIVLVAPVPEAVTPAPTKLSVVAVVDNELPSSCTIIPDIPPPPPPDMAAVVIPVILPLLSTVMTGVSLVEP